MTTINLFLDKRTTNKYGQHPIKILLFHAGKQRLFSTNESATVDVYQNLHTSKKHDDKQLSRDIGGKKANAEAIIKLLGNTFQWETFKKMFYSKINYVTKGSLISVPELYKECIEEMNINQCFNNAEAYANSLKALEKFNCGPFTLQEVTPQFCKKFEMWMLNNNKRISTVYSYLRPLRAIYNQAIERKNISEETFPFGKTGYSIKNSQLSDATLYTEEVIKFWDYECINDAQQRAKDYWFFSYFCFGMNPIDMAKLNLTNYQPDRLIFSRSKNLKSSSTVKMVTISLPAFADDLKDIIKRRGNPSSAYYLFPILKKGMSSKEQHDTIDKWKRCEGKILKRIGKKLGFHTALVLGCARHTSADSLAWSGKYNEKIIADAMGNQNSSMAKHYIGSLNQQKSHEMAKHLIYKSAS